MSDKLAQSLRIEGYAIVSVDGMLADHNGHMPDALKIDADQQFFTSGLDNADVVVHGRHSHEGQPRSGRRRRLIVTRQIATVQRLAPSPEAAPSPRSSPLRAPGAPHARPG